MRTCISIVLLAFLIAACTKSGSNVIFTPDNPNFSYIGRFDLSDKAKPVFMYSGCAIRTVFKGTSVELILKDDSLRNRFTVLLDDSLFVLTANHADSIYLLADRLADTKHRLEIIRRTEWHGGNSTFLGLRLNGDGKLYLPEVNSRRIEFIGNSYTCGYGNEGKSQQEHFNYETENNYLSFGAVTARALSAEYTAVCRSGIGIVQGYGGGRDFNMPRLYDEVINHDSTKTWDYTKNQPQLVVIDLGGNDLSAPLDSAEFVNAYVKFLGRIRRNYAAARIVCIAGPASPDDKKWSHWQNLIHSVVNEFGKTDTAVHYFAFKPLVLHGSDWHPNVADDKQMADELAPYLQKLMRW